MGSASDRALLKGRQRHRQALSISSLPLENLESANRCERRACVSALSSPARALTEPENNNNNKNHLSIATFLGHGVHSTKSKLPRNSSEILNCKGTELATEDRKPTSFNPFRGHRRVGSESNIIPTPSSPAPPKKLDKYAVAKIAASLFHSPAKLEGSMSLMRPAQIQSTQHRVGEEESATPQLASNESCIMQKNIIDITKPGQPPPAATPVKEDPPPIPEGVVLSNSQQAAAEEDAAEMKMISMHEELLCRDAAVSLSSSPRSSCWMSATNEATSMQLPDYPAALFEDSNGDRDDLQSKRPFAAENVTSEAEHTEAAVRCSRISSKYMCDVVSTGRVSISPKEEEVEDEEGEESLPNPIISKDTTTTTRASSLTRNNSSVVGDEFAGCKRTISVVKSTLQKRRRSVSASGIDAMLLAMVRVPESKPVVTRRQNLGPPAEMVSKALEKTAQIETVEPIVHTSAAPVVRLTDSKDAVQSTYFKFLDIKIDHGHGNIKIVQRSNAHGGFDNAGWKRNRRASPKRRPIVKINTCTVYEEKPRSRKTKTIRSSQMDSYDLDYLREYLKTTNLCSDQRAQGHMTTTDRPAAKLTTEANHNVAMSTWERSQTFVSKLQAPSSVAFSYIDEYRSCSVSVRSNHSFSSSHQDKLWEERIESYRYSSEGCGSPDREDEAAASAAARLIRAANRVAVTTPETFVSRLQAPSSGAFSSVDAYNPSYVSVLSNPSFSSSHQDQLWEEQADIYSRRDSPGRGFEELSSFPATLTLPLSPPRNQIFNLHHSLSPTLGRSNSAGNHSLRRSRFRRSPSASSESGHFMHHFMSLIRGGSPKSAAAAGAASDNGHSSCPNKSQLNVHRRRNSWSSCICPPSVIC